MNKINTHDEFMQWAQNVKHATIQCDLQDRFAYTDTAILKSMFLDAPKNDKHLLIFSIQKCMGSDMLLKFINTYARSKAEEYIEKEQVDIATKWDEVLVAKKEQEKQVEHLENMLTQELGITKSYAASIHAHKQEITQLSKENRSLQNTVDNLQSENQELRQFENHIKGLLND